MELPVTAYFGVSPYGVFIKVGLTETLTFISGFVFGSIAGFLTGALIIVVSDLYIAAGVWTPFIALIIGVVFGCGAGVVHRYIKEPSLLTLGLSAGILTVISEVLQNLWVAWFFNLPIWPTMLAGVPSLITALVNNVILIGVLGPRVIRFVQKVNEKTPTLLANSSRVQ
jgi:uncharacterized membrane protein